MKVLLSITLLIVKCVCIHLFIFFSSQVSIARKVIYYIWPYIYVGVHNFFVNKFERNIAPPESLGEELYDMISQYDDIVFCFHSSKQKFHGFGVTHNWIQ